MHNLHIPRQVKGIVLGFGIGCMCLAVSTPAIAGPCQDMRQTFRNDNKAVAKQCREKFRQSSHCVLLVCVRDNTACWEKIAVARRIQQTKVAECFSHQNRMKKLEKKRRAEKVRAREKLRQSERRARENAKRERTRFSKTFNNIKRVAEKTENFNGYLTDFKTLANSKNWRKQYDAVQRIANRTNDLATRQPLSQDLTARVLSGLSTRQIDMFTKFEAAMKSTSKLHETTTHRQQQLRARNRQVDGNSEELQRAAATARARQRAAAKELARQRSTNSRAKQRAAATERERQRAIQRNNNNAALGEVLGVIAGVGIAGALNANKQRSTRTRKAPARPPAGRSRGGCTDGEFINC